MGAEEKQQLLQILIKKESVGEVQLINGERKTVSHQELAEGRWVGRLGLERKMA